MKAHEGGAGEGAGFQQRKQLHGGVAKIDVQEPSFAFAQHLFQPGDLPPGDENRTMGDVAVPETPDFPDQSWRTGQQDELFRWEGKFLRMKAFVRQHYGRAGVESCDLAVNVPHFRCEEGGAVTGHHREAGRSGDGRIRHGPRVSRRKVSDDWKNCGG